MAKMKKTAKKALKIKEQKQEYLIDLRDAFLKKGFNAKLAYKDRLGGSSLVLTAKKHNDIFQIRLEAGKKSMLGDYSMSVYSTGEAILGEAVEINKECRPGMWSVKRDKKKFHDNLGNGVKGLSTNYSTYKSRAGSEASLESKLSSIRSESKESKYIDALDNVEFAVGIAYDMLYMQAVYALATEGYQSAGFLPYDPATDSVGFDDYSGFGTYGIDGAGDAGGLGDFTDIGASAAAFEASELSNIVGESGGSFLDSCNMPDLDGCGGGLDSCDIGGCDF